MSGKEQVWAEYTFGQRTYIGWLEEVLTIYSSLKVVLVQKGPSDVPDELVQTIGKTELNRTDVYLLKQVPKMGFFDWDEKYGGSELPLMGVEKVMYAEMKESELGRSKTVTWQDPPSPPMPPKNWGWVTGIMKDLVQRIKKENEWDDFRPKGRDQFIPGVLECFLEAKLTPEGKPRIVGFAPKPNLCKHVVTYKESLPPGTVSIPEFIVPLQMWITKNDSSVFCPSAVGWVGVDYTCEGTYMEPEKFVVFVMQDENILHTQVVTIEKP